MDCPTCQRQMWAVEYRLTPCDYDGTSEWHCQSCNLRIGRWSGLELHEGELEPRYGRNSPYKISPFLLDGAGSTGVSSEQAETNKPVKADTSEIPRLFGGLED